MNANLESESFSSEAARKRRTRVMWAIFFVVWIVHMKSKVAQDGDSGWCIPLALSLLEENDVYLDEFREMGPEDDWRLVEVDGHACSYFPVAPAVVAAPAVSVFRSLLRHGYGIKLEDHIRARGTKEVERLISSLFMAMASVLLFILASRHLTQSWALVATVIFAFGSSVFSVVSRGLWNHGPSLGCLLLVIYFLDRARTPDEEKSGKQLFWSGFFLAAAFTMRPTNAVSVLVISAYVLFTNRHRLHLFLAGALPVAVTFLTYSWRIHHNIFPPYFQAGNKLSSENFVEGLLGTLISPGRGLFIYSPIFLLCFLGVWLRLRRRQWTALDTALSVVLVSHWMIISARSDWWGGWVFGPRYFSDMVPILVYFLFPVFQAIERPELRKWQRVLAIVAIAALTITSIWIHRKGATYWSTWRWNAIPSDINLNTHRLWDWDDLPFLREKHLV